MIITRLFSITTPFPPSLAQQFRIPLDKLESSFIRIERSGRFVSQYNSLSPDDKSKVDRFIQDLESGFIFSDSDSNDRTHYLGNESKPSKGFVVFSKQINREDRFNYLIYKPETSDEGESYIQKIVLSSCSEHTLSGRPGSYVSGQRGNTWKKRRKTAEKKRFDKKK